MGGRLTLSKSPERWAIEISVILKTVLQENRFPVDVRNVAKEISLKKFPDDPITMVKGNDLPGFEGALMPAPKGKIGWGIIYNSSSSTGRINFTIAHEFGHYLLHRKDYPKGFDCSADDMRNWDSKFGQLEHQANAFAANLLMPFDDFRKQIDVNAIPSIQDLKDCAARYGVSLTSAISRWLQYTKRRAVLVISREDFILWARSSESALKTGLYYKVKDTPPVEISIRSLPRQNLGFFNMPATVDHPKGVWLGQPCVEEALSIKQYNFSISLLHFDDYNYDHKQNTGG